jgi:hypothetical protein
MNFIILEKGQNRDNGDISRYPKGELHKKLKYSSMDSHGMTQLCLK